MAINPIQVQKFLGGIDYPTSKQDLIKAAQKHGADSAAMETIKSLKWERFNSPNDVSEAIGELKQQPAGAKKEPANAKKQPANAKKEPAHAKKR
jgi:Protein of unknown function (DUF2795)